MNFSARGTGIAIRFDARYVVRAASAALVSVFAALIVCSLIGASQIKARTKETLAAVWSSERYEYVERLLWKEANLVRVHGFDPQGTDWTTNVHEQHEAAAEVERTLAAIDAAGDADDRRLVTATVRAHAAYTDLLHTLFAKIDASDPAARETFRRTTAVFDRMQAEIDARASRQHETAVAALLRLETTQGYVAGTIVTSSIVAAVLLAASAVLTSRYRATIEATRTAELERLERASLTDDLTGLGNSRAFQEEMERALSLAARRGDVLSLALIDVDHFKSVNDSCGHAQGDVVLAALGRLLGRTRASDRGFRLGGDEFGVICPATDIDQASVIMERLRRDAAEALAGSTVSIGIASASGHTLDSVALRARADAALYAAKRRGRNAVATDDSATVDGEIGASRV